MAAMKSATLSTVGTALRQDFHAQQYAVIVWWRFQLKSATMAISSLTIFVVQRAWLSMAGVQCRLAQCALRARESEKTCHGINSAADTIAPSQSVVPWKSQKEWAGAAAEEDRATAFVEMAS
jgi:hypothetical protein